MNAVERLTRERKAIVARIDRIDEERQALKSKIWHLERKPDGKKLVGSLKRKRELLFSERNTIRTRLGDINQAVKELRRAGLDQPTDTLGSAFQRVAKRELDQEMYEKILDQAVLQCPTGNTK